MKYLLIALVLMSSSAMAEWTFVGTNKANNVSNYIDTDTFKRTGDKDKAWALYNWHDGLRVKSGMMFSIKGRVEFNCREDEIRLLAHHAYNKEMGLGKNIESSEKREKEWDSVLPGSMHDGLLQAACNGGIEPAPEWTPPKNGYKTI